MARDHLQSNPAADRPILRDGAIGEIDRVTADMQSLARLASDLDLPLKQRLEAFREIIDSEVGDTLLLRARNLERHLGVRRLYLKFEGGNPTGTQKDRIAFAQVYDALAQGYRAITVATCGNFGVAVALAAALGGLRSIIFIPESYHSRRIEEMQRLTAEVRRVPTDYEGAVKKSIEEASTRGYYDANPGGGHAELQIRGYSKIAEEIFAQVGGELSAVAVPVSNGTTIAGIYRGFQDQLREGRILSLPRLIAGSSHGKNPIVRSWMKGFREYQDLPPERIRETQINEPLVNWHSSEGQPALHSIYDSEGWAANASDRQMRRFSRLLRDLEGLHVLPASTAGLIALVDGKVRRLEPGYYVSLLTGRKS